jgi:hypothetical protein
MLSQRAQRYLATLQRETPIPTSDVERMLLEQGVPAFDAWLSFHDEFAGYWEDLGGGDLSVWGLAREKGGWVRPRSVDVTPRRDGSPLYVWCADTHPSHDYKLMTDGVFLGPPYRSHSFSVKVERNSLSWDFARGGPASFAYNGNQVPAQDRAQLLADMAPYLVAEASDEFARYYSSQDKLLCEELTQGSLRLLERAP